MSLCETCVCWKPQKSNSHMGHCMAPIPAVLVDEVGSARFKKGVYAWKGAVVRNCPARVPLPAAAGEKP